MENLKNDLADLVGQMEMGKCSNLEVIKVLNNIVSYYSTEHKLLTQEKFQLVADLVQTRINDLTDSIDPLNGENDQELIKAISNEILLLDDFLKVYYKED
jgi:hypothetical protein